LKSENLPSYSLGKLDKSELMFVEEVVVPALVDDPYEIVLGCSGIGQNSIDLAEDERGFIPRSPSASAADDIEFHPADSVREPTAQQGQRFRLSRGAYIVIGADGSERGATYVPGCSSSL
jgi:hypothetical protein